MAELVRYQQGVGKSGWNSRSRDRRRELPQYWRDSLPLVAVNRKPTGASGRQAPGKCHLRPTLKHERGSCPHHLLHGRCHTAPAVHSRLLLLPRGPVNASLAVSQNLGCTREEHQYWCSSRVHLLVKANSSVKVSLLYSGSALQLVRLHRVLLHRERVPVLRGN